MKQILTKSRNYISLQYVSIVFFALTIVLIHLPLGGSREWVVYGCLLLTYITLAIIIIRHFLRRVITFTLSPVYIFLGSLILLALIQIFVSCDNMFFPGNNYSVWEKLSSFLSRDIYPTISLTPSLTKSYLALFCLALFTFFISLELFKTKKFFLLLPVIFLFSLALNSFFGFYNQIDINSDRLFCYVPPWGSCTAGTFINRNHFAVLMEMGLCTSLGLFAAAYFSRSIKHKKALLTGSSILFCFFIISILFSFSRTGISLSIFTLFLFFIAIISELKRRRKIFRSIYLFLGLAAALSLAASRGLSYVLDRYETSFNTQDPSLLSRFDFWSTTIDLIKDYWVMGAGFGSFTYVSTRFETGLIPGKIANHAHNDWLELFAEVGVPCAICIIIFIIVFYVINMRKIITQENTVKKWLGLGAGLSILSVMLHEIVGFAIRTPGVLILFSVLVVIFAICADEPRIKAINLSKSVRYTYLSVSLLLLGGLVIRTIPLISSGYALESLVDRHRACYPLHTNMSEYDDALYQIKLADKVLKTQNSPVAYMVKGQSQYLIADHLFRQAESTKQEIRNNLLSAIKNMKIALESYPTRALYYVRLAYCLEYLLQINNLEDKGARGQYWTASSSLLGCLSPDPAGRKQLEKSIAEAFSAAYFYSPNVGSITRSVAFGKWRMIERRLMREKFIEIEDCDVQEAMVLFKEYASQTPRDTYEIYNAIWASVHSKELLHNITPDYISAHTNLYMFFLNNGLYDDADSELNIILSLSEKINTPELSHFEEFRKTRKTEEQLKEFVYSQKATLCSFKNDWSGYHQKIELCKQNLRERLDVDLDQLTLLYDAGKYNRVNAGLRHVLRQDPTYKRAISLAAEVSLKLGNEREYQKHIISLILSNEITDLPVRGQYRTGDSLGPDPTATYRTLLDQLKQANNSEEPHLIYYLKGKILFEEKKYNKALNAYIKALTLTPRALFIVKTAIKTRDYMVKNSIKIDQSNAIDLAPFIQWEKTINPQEIVNINFNNSVNLYGISVSKKEITSMESIEITYYWECKNLIDREYIVASYFANGDKLKFAESHTTGSTGDDMVSWEIGEIIEDKREIKPAVYSLRQNNSLPPNGPYFLSLRLYTGGVDSHSISPIVHTAIPVFEVVKE